VAQSIIAGTKECFKGHTHPQPPPKLCLLARGVATHPFNALAQSARPHVGHLGPFFPAVAIVVVVVTPVVCCCSVAGAQTTLIQLNPGILGIAGKL
jgi:hypothetical protein